MHSSQFILINAPVVDEDSKTNFIALKKNTIIKQ